MTLDEAIQHCKEKAAELKSTAEKQWNDGKMALIDYTDCRECAREHEQLAEWLTELKEHKDGRITCEFCRHENKAENEFPCSICKYNHPSKFESKEATTSGENDWYDIPAEQMTKEQAQKAVKELRKALLEARTEAKNG